MRSVAFLLILLFVALDLAAVHDILHGEPDIRLEVGMLVLSSVSFGVMGILAWKKKTKESQQEATV